MRSLRHSGSTVISWWGQAAAIVLERGFRLTSRNPVEASLVLLLSLALVLVICAWL